MKENTPPRTTESKKQGLIRWVPVSLIFLISWLLASLLLCFEFQQRFVGSEFVIGEPSPRTIFSSQEFSYENKPATQQLREEAAKSAEPVYRIQAEPSELALKKLNGFFEAIDLFEKQKLANPTQQIPAPKLPFDASKSLSQAVFGSNFTNDLREIVPSLVQKTFSRGVFDLEEKKNLQAHSISGVILLNEGEPERLVPTSEIFSTEDLRSFGEAFLNPEVQKNKTLKNASLDLLTTLIKPNVVKDDKAVQERQKRAAEAVAPIMNKIKKNEMIAQQGILISPQAKEKIDHIVRELKKHQLLNQFIAIAGFVSLMYILALLGFYFFSLKTLLSLRQTLLFHVILLTALFISKLIAIWPGSSLFFMPTALVPLLLVLLSGTFPAVIGVGVVTGLAALLTKFNIEIIFATLTAGFVAVLAGQKIRKRIQLVQVGAAMGCSYAAVIFFLRIFYESPVYEALQVSSFGIINGIMTLVIGYLLAALFEVIFNLTTDIYLLEMSDLNHPLMKRMIVEAPGTYHHSLVVSTLAEAASEEIGANALLARVGCYFHDIGKIAQSEYFTENSMQTAKLRHDALTSSESLDKIRDHVKGGIELGMKYKLKQPILDFIPEHQGTGVVYYFYRKALDEAKPGQRIEMDQYRYPGPKPQTRETAIALLADSTEAASRSLKDPNPDSIRRLVRKIINDKFIDGQLDECTLTLQDLHKIQNSFVKNLMAIFHTRVAYPEKPASSDQVDIFCDHTDHS